MDGAGLPGAIFTGRERPLVAAGRDAGRAGEAASGLAGLLLTGFGTVFGGAFLVGFAGRTPFAVGRFAGGLPTAFFFAAFFGAFLATARLNPQEPESLALQT
jgi:hypothetical protein